MILEEKTGINPANKLDQFIYYSDLQTAEDVNMLYKVDKALFNLK